MISSMYTAFFSLIPLFHRWISHLPAALRHEGCDRDQKVPNASSGESVNRWGVTVSITFGIFTSHFWLDPSLGKMSCIQIWYPIVSKYNCVCHITSMTSNLSYIDLYINWYKCVTIVTIVSQLYVQVPASFFTFKLHKIIPKSPPQTRHLPGAFDRGKNVRWFHKALDGRQQKRPGPAPSNCLFQSNASNSAICRVVVENSDHVQ